MKTFNSLLLLLSICIVSCEKTDDLSTPDAEISPIKTTHTRDVAPLTPAEILENKMQWISFLAARAIIEDDSGLVKAEFINAITIGINNQHIIKLVDLLDSENVASHFYPAFEAQLIYYVQGQGRPGGDDGPMSGNPPGNVGGTGNCNLFCTYLEEILVNNCFEIYLPNGYNTNLTKIYTTAHPLTSINGNNGFEHLSDDPTDTPSLPINGINVIHYKNTLATRPYTDHSNENCSYSDYPIDFTIFLN